MSDEINPVSMLAIDQLATALAKAQRAIKHAEKSQTNPHFGKKYATLADVIDACREPLADNDLSYVQKVSSAQGVVIVETVLMHKSGQSIAATLTMPARNDAQGIGSALTYARRYGLSAMVGVAPDEDDDGNGAGKGDELQPRGESRRAGTPQRGDDYHHTDRREPARGHQQAPASGSVSGDMSEKQIDAAISKVFKEIRGIAPEITAGVLREEAAVPPTGTLTIDQKKIVLRSMEQRLKSMRAAMEGDPPPDEDA
jgi:hypothetical protein